MTSITLAHVEQAYLESDAPIDNEALYARVAKLAGIDAQVIDQKTPVGVSGQPRSLFKRRVRWLQQTLKQLGVLRKVTGERGVWDLCERQKSGLHQAMDGVRLIAYSTSLGFAVWGSSKGLFEGLEETIHLCLTSPPYPLRVARSYGNVDEQGWVDFMTGALESVVRHLAPGGSIVLNISNDIFEAKRPSRSLYLERLVLALHDRLGLHLMDRIPWINLSKPPGPTYWACVNRVQLCSGWEPVLWFTNDPQRVRADNRRVLQPHSESHQRLLMSGGEKRTAAYGDGVYRLRAGESFARQTPGRIPKNVIERGHRCADTQAAHKASDQLHLPRHGAMFPSSLPEFFIDFLTEPGELVVDPFSVSNKTGLAAQRKGRRWISAEIMLEYVRIQAELFKGYTGFWQNRYLEGV